MFDQNEVSGAGWSASRKGAWLKGVPFAFNRNLEGVWRKGV